MLIQRAHGCGLFRLGVGVVVSVLAGVEDGGEGLEGGVGDFDADGGLSAGFVPQDGEVEGCEQACLEPLAGVALAVAGRDREAGIAAAITRSEDEMRLASG